MSATDHIATVEKCYIAYYGRTGDTEGIAYWAARLDHVNGDLTEIIDAFANSQESQSLYGGLGDAAKINTVYQQVFARDADPGGLAYYTDALSSGRMSQGSIALDILNGAQGSDLESIENQVQSAMSSMDMGQFNSYVDEFSTSFNDDQSGSIIPDDLSGNYDLIDFEFDYDGQQIGPADINYDFDGDLTITSEGATSIYLDIAGSQQSANGTLTQLDENTLIDNNGDTTDFWIDDDIMTWSLDEGQLGYIGMDAMLDWQYIV